MAQFFPLSFTYLWPLAMLAGLAGTPVPTDTLRRLGQPSATKIKQTDCQLTRLPVKKKGAA